MRHQPRDTTVAIAERMNPEKSMMSRRNGNHLARLLRRVAS